MGDFDLGSGNASSLYTARVKHSFHISCFVTHGVLVCLLFMYYRPANASIEATGDADLNTGDASSLYTAGGGSPVPPPFHHSCIVLLFFWFRPADIYIEATGDFDFGSGDASSLYTTGGQSRVYTYPICFPCISYFSSLSQACERFSRSDWRLRPGFRCRRWLYRRGRQSLPCGLRNSRHMPRPLRIMRRVLPLHEGTFIYINMHMYI